jgi:hypothetical protein
VQKTAGWPFIRASLEGNCIIPCIAIQRIPFVLLVAVSFLKCKLLFQYGED